LLVSALLIGLAPSVNSQGPGKAEPKKSDPKAKSKETDKPTEPPPLKLTIVSKDKDKDVIDTVKMINEKLAAGWKANNIVHSRWADDYEFLRRASLDIIGRIATPAEIHEYFVAPRETRRSLLIDRLLAKPEYASHWANVWTNWLLTRSGIFGRGMYHEQTQKWLKDQFALNRPYDQIVRDLITASGKNSDNGAVNFILAHVGENTPRGMERDEGQFQMVPITSRITRLFLATQVQCAQCHDHPFSEAIKQNHFWGVNAFLRQVQRVGNIPMRRQDGLMTLELRDNPDVNDKPVVVYEKRNGVLLEAKAEFLPTNGQKKGPRLAAGVKGNQRRVELANYVIDHENFPKAIVNRMWGVFFGRGFTQPIDDFNDNNKPTNEELIDELAARFKNYNYNMHKLIRWICNSDAYNLSVIANSTNDKPEQEALFSRMLMKAMSPEQLFESMMVATNSAVLDNTEEKNKLRTQWLDRLVSSFGDDEGNEVNFNGTVVQALLMMNGEDINNAIGRKEKGTVAMAIIRYRSGPAVIKELYLASLNRPPTTRELAYISSRMHLDPRNPLAREKDIAAPFQDMFWALLNSNEFILNH
jgi:hypothetical protein